MILRKRKMGEPVMKTRMISRQIQNFQPQQVEMSRLQILWDKKAELKPHKNMGIQGIMKILVPKSIIVVRPQQPTRIPPKLQTSPKIPASKNSSTEKMQDKDKNSAIMQNEDNNSATVQNEEKRSHDEVSMNEKEEVVTISGTEILKNMGEISQKDEAKYDNDKNGVKNAGTQNVQKGNESSQNQESNNEKGLPDGISLASVFQEIDFESMYNRKEGGQKFAVKSCGRLHHIASHIRYSPLILIRAVMNPIKENDANFESVRDAIISCEPCAEVEKAFRLPYLNPNTLEYLPEDRPNLYRALADYVTVMKEIIRVVGFPALKLLPFQTIKRNLMSKDVRIYSSDTFESAL